MAIYGQALTNLGSYSFFVYLAHYPVLSVYKKIIPNPSILTHWLILSCVGFIVPVLINIFLIKYFPNVMGCITGGRVFPRTNNEKS